MSLVSRLAALALPLPLIAACGGAIDGQFEEDVDEAMAQGLCQGAPYPIVMAHGMAGWDQIGSALGYYFQVADDLRGRGERVFLPQVSPFDSSAVRGGQLAAAIKDVLQTTSACKVNIIAHSQGGLDARYAISAHRLGGRVASLTTVATPHQGSLVADVALGLIPGVSYPIINAVLTAYAKIIGAPAGSPGLRAQLRQLSSPEMATFNASHPDDRRVSYYSVAGRSSLRVAEDECRGGLWDNSERGDSLNLLFSGTQLVFALRAKDPLRPEVNDGLVTITSARRGRFLGCVAADHLDEIGQFLKFGTDLLSGYNHKDMYRRIVQQIHNDGF